MPNPDSPRHAMPALLRMLVHCEPHNSTLFGKPGSTRAIVDLAQQPETQSPLTSRRTWPPTAPA